VTALRFFFIVTLRKPQVVIRLPFIREQRKLPIVLRRPHDHRRDLRAWLRAAISPDRSEPDRQLMIANRPVTTPQC
jgi:hypothetical protein